MPPADQPPEAALVEPLLPPLPTEEAAIVSLIPQDGSPFVGTVNATSEAPREPELIVLSVDDSVWEHGEEQELKFQNPFFGVLFLAQAITLLVFGIHAMKTFSSEPPTDTTDDDDNGDGGMDWKFVSYYAKHFLFAFLCTMVSIIVLSATTLSYLLRQTGATRRMIEMSLIFAPVSYALSAIGAMAVGMIPAALFFLVFGLISTCFVIRVWNRIPVAAANLAIAMTAVKAHQGSLITLGYSMTFVAASWACMWVLAVGDIGVRDSSFFWQCQAPSSPQDDPNCSVTSGGVCVGLLLLLCLFWTIQVIKNLCHTTVAGVVGTWWFSATSSPDEEVADTSLIQESSASPSKVVYDAWVRSSVYSFGSICFGSLVVGLLQVLQLVLKCGRDQNRQRNQNSSGGLVLCICQCIVNYLEKLAEYMNKWAFVYVGLYGYDYWTAGSKVYNLFKARGWSVILNDHLIARYLTLLQAILSLLSAVVCQFWGWLFVIRPLSAALRQAAENDPNNNNGPADMSVLWYSFFSIGFVLGMSLSSVLFRIVSSAVDTIVVCFAEAPNQLGVLGRRQQSPMVKPSLANEMITAWRQVYPHECGF